MVLDTADAEAFDTTVSQVAAQLGRLGDHHALDIRRARAVGILADPQVALALSTEGETTGRTPAKPSTLYLHLDQSALLGLDTFPAAIRAEGLRQGMGVLSGVGTVTVARRYASTAFSAHHALAPLTGSGDGVPWHMCRRGGPRSCATDYRILRPTRGHQCRGTPSLGPTTRSQRSRSPRSAEATIAPGRSAVGTPDAGPTAATAGPHVRDRSNSSRHAHATDARPHRTVGVRP